VINRTEPAPVQVGDGYDSERLLRAPEVGKILGVPVKRVYELPIPHVRIGRRSLRWRWLDLEEFIERRLETV